jgi:hypothetical protein
MTLVQIAFIFNVVSAFLSIATTVRARSADCNECDLVQCAIVSRLERRNWLGQSTQTLRLV